MIKPEQLAKWREEFEESLPIGERHRLPSQGYASFRIEFEWRGYLRRCQETKQALKQISADDVTYNMMADCNNNAESVLSPADFAAAVNAYLTIRTMSELK